MNMDKIKTFVIEKVLWAEKNLKGKFGAEKKQAVIKAIDDLSGRMTSLLLVSLTKFVKN